MSAPTPDPLDQHAVTLDLERNNRCGYPEVLYGEGKTPETIVAVANELLSRDQRVLVTRVDADKAAAVIQLLPSMHYNPLARTLRMEPESRARAPVGQVAIITAGTSDLAVAEEARETLAWMGVGVTMIHDVGVAGPHRLASRVADFSSADAVVVVAGMEGALPSVVGGYISAPVIAIPTSVGYGANLGGIAALLSMLNSCAANVAVVNIDAGFKGGYLAGLIVGRIHRGSETG